MRIREADLDFSDKNIIGILGRGVTDSKRSNFLGKSSILEAIRYAITGNSRASEGRDVKETDLIHHGEESMMVMLMLEEDGQKYIIKRGRDSKNNGVLETNWASDKAKAQEFINNAINMTPDDFDLTVFFKQSEISQFMDLGPAEKKKVLMRWQNIDHWTDKEKKVLEDLKREKNILRDRQIELATMQKSVEKPEDIVPELEDAKYQIEQLDEKISKLKTQLSNLGTSVSESEVLRLQNIKNKLHRQISEYQDHTSELSARYNKIKEDINSVESSYDADEINKKIKEHERDVNEYRIQARNLKSKIDIGPSKDGLCPIINEPCDRITYTESQISSFKKKLEEITKEGQSINVVIGSLKDDLKKLTDVKLYKMKLETISKDLESEVTKKETLKKNKQEYLEVSEKLKAADPEKISKMENIQTEISNSETQRSRLNQKIGILNHKLEMFSKSEKQIEILQSELMKQSQIIEDLNFVSYMFGKNGIVSLEIENSFSQIEEEINYVLSLFYDSLSVQFEADRETKAWETHCLSCGTLYEKGTKKLECSNCGTIRQKKRVDELRLDIIENGNVTPFKMASGGLKTIISIAVRTALTMLVKRRNNTNFNVIFLDEIDSALDSFFKERVMFFVKETLTKKLGFEQVFWISHDKSISENLDDIIMVRGFETYSKLVWA